MADMRLMWVTDVHNFGGFFGGDTVTLSAIPWPAGEEITLTIDEKALENIKARHLVAPEMLFSFDFAGERIDHARLLGARGRDELDAALGDAPTSDHLAGPRIRAYHCATCDIWLSGQPVFESGTPLCAICSSPLH